MFKLIAFRKSVRLKINSNGPISSDFHNLSAVTVIIRTYKWNLVIIDDSIENELDYLLFGSEHYLAWIVAKEKSEVWRDTRKWMETLWQLAGENFLEIMIRMAKG